MKSMSELSDHLRGRAVDLYRDPYLGGKPALRDCT